MSGAAPSLRSLWFGDGRTSATTQESGRISDTSITIRGPHTRSRKADDVRKTDRSSRQDWMELCRNNDVTQVQAARGRVDCDESNIVLLVGRTQARAQKRSGRPGRRLGRL